MSLQQFRHQLASDFPEARIDLTHRVGDAPDALARLECIGRHYIEIVGCAEALGTASEYDDYIQRLANVMEIDPDEMGRLLKLAVGGSLMAGVLGVMAADGALHTADAATTAADAGLHGADVFDAKFTLGASILASIGLAYVCSWLNRSKREELERLISETYLTARLANALITSASLSTITDVDRRLGELRPPAA